MGQKIKTAVRNHFLKFLLMMGLFSGVTTLILGIDLLLTTIDGGSSGIAIALTFSSFAGFVGSLWFCLKASAERMETLRLLDAIHIIQNPILITDQKGGTLFANNSFRELFPSIDGVPFDRLLRDLDGSIPPHLCDDGFSFPPDTESKNGIYINEIPVNYGKNPQKNYYFKRHTQGESGDIVWALVDDSPYQIEFRTALYAQSHFLKSFEIREIFDLSPVGIVILDPDGVIQVYNQRFSDSFLQAKITPGRVVFQDLLMPEQQVFFKEAFDGFITGNSPDPRPVEITFSQNADLSSICYFGYLRDQKTPSIGPNQGGVALYIFDNRPQQEMQKKLSQAQRLQAMGQLSGGIAHDFNNLLTAMIGFCDLLLSRLSPADQSFTDMMQIKQNAHRAAALVKQLLAFSRQQSLIPKIIQVSDILSNISNLLDRLIGVHIRLRMIHGRAIGTIRADTGQLEQVLMNLVVNARDAIDGRGEIIIRTSQKNLIEPLNAGLETIAPGHYVCIDVIDTGRGIPADVMGRIFDPFYSTKEVGSGTGLGLSTVYGIVRQTGGHITVESTVGSGTTFTLYFPEYLAGPGDIQTQCPGGNAFEFDALMTDLTGSGNILIVEDEDAVRLFSSRALREKGYTVIEASSGEEGLTHIRSAASTHKFIDLIITDVIMPVMDGPTMIERARQIYPNIQVIFISGYALDSFRSELSEKDHVHFLPKPFSLKELAAKVKSVISESQKEPPISNDQTPHLPAELASQESLIA